jgi:hypothetical protein
MLLSARILANCTSPNEYEPRDYLEATEGDSFDLYLQLLDASRDRADQGFYPPGRRFVPPVGAVLQVTFPHINDDKTVTRLAVPAFPGDTSIWRVPVLAEDKLVGTRDIVLVLRENGPRATTGTVKGGLRVIPNRRGH